MTGKGLVVVRWKGRGDRVGVIGELRWWGRVRQEGKIWEGGAMALMRKMG